MRGDGLTPGQIERTPVYRGFEIRDGHGIMFVSNQGDIFPSGFLPLATGNVRSASLLDVYRDSPCSVRCTLRVSSKANVGSANSEQFAVARARGHLRLQATNWLVIPSVPISHAADGTLHRPHDYVRVIHSSQFR